MFPPIICIHYDFSLSLPSFLPSSYLPIPIPIILTLPVPPPSLLCFFLFLFIPFYFSCVSSFTLLSSFFSLPLLTLPVYPPSLFYFFFFFFLSLLTLLVYPPSHFSFFLFLFTPFLHPEARSIFPPIKNSRKYRHFGVIYSDRFRTQLHK